MVHASSMSRTNSTKTTIRTQIRSLLDYLNHLNDTVGQDDSDEYLALKRVRGTTRFFIRSKDGRCAYLSTSKRDEISRLAHKSYLRELKKAAKNEIAQLEKCLNILDSGKKGISDINEVYDAKQKAQLRFLSKDNHASIELIYTDDPESRVFNLSHNNYKIEYHTCFEVDNLKQFIDIFSNEGYLLITNIEKAELFDGKICFMYKNGSLIELTEII